MERLIAIQEASVLLGLKVPTIYKKICRRELPHIKLGGKILFRPSELELWVQKHSVPTLDLSSRKKSN